ncbi:hypothetical protein NL676_018732 [Syzygium grande]|nr:hypothetical protein NL676_018732 [Syzygium grande]
MDGEEEVAVAAEADFLQSSTVVDSGGKKLWPLHHVVKTEKIAQHGDTTTGQGQNGQTPLVARVVGAIHSARRRWQ